MPYSQIIQLQQPEQTKPLCITPKLHTKCMVWVSYQNFSKTCALCNDNFYGSIRLGAPVTAFCMHRLTWCCLPCLLGISHHGLHPTMPCTLFYYQYPPNLPRAWSLITQPQNLLAPPALQATSYLALGKGSIHASWPAVVFQQLQGFLKIQTTERCCIPVSSAECAAK